jgi:two-component system catabolic regulation response regulator CreB
MPQVLVVEDEIAIADTLLFALGSDGFTTRWTRLAGEALRQVSGAPVSKC